jgi:DNA polymerase
MKVLSIDLETFSSYNLKKCGAYRYTQAPDFQILMLAYSFDDEPVQVIDLWDDLTDSWLDIPDFIITALFDETILKRAYNAAFERTCLNNYMRYWLEANTAHGSDSFDGFPVEQWECTMARASLLSLPLGLDRGAAALRLPVTKDPAGKALIKYFCEPCKPTKVNGMRTRNLPSHDYDKWERFKEYCKKDVVVEKAILSKISFLEPTAFERRVWLLDQKINDHGVLIDEQLVREAIKINETYAAKLMARARAITGIANPNSTGQLLAWLNDSLEFDGENLKKDTVTDALDGMAEGAVKSILEIRQQLSKSSIKKYLAMIEGLGYDNRIRGLLQYGGASRTMRNAGRLLQIHNLPKTFLHDLDLARILAKEGDLEMLEMLFGNVPDTMSQLIRTCLIAPLGKKLLVSDFSAIEARVLAWLAGEQWRIDVFNGDGKIYEAGGSKMFKVPIESIKKGSKLRDKSKIGDLACGFQGGVNALLKMGAIKMGMIEEELPGIVEAWREANPNIVKFWYAMGSAAIECVKTQESQKVGYVTFKMIKGSLFMYLPSGRPIVYLRPKLEKNQFDRDSITYEGMDQNTGKWLRISTYGGKLAENLTQSVARDILWWKMLELNENGYHICMHVHDEVVLEVPEDSNELDNVNAIMANEIPWAKGLPLKGDSFETFYYKKD